MTYKNKKHKKRNIIHYKSVQDKSVQDKSIQDKSVQDKNVQEITNKKND